MFQGILAFLSQKLLLIGAAIGSLYILWLKRSETKAREEAKDARFVSVQAQKSQEQVAEMVEKAHDVLEKQGNVDDSSPDWDSIDDWLREQSYSGSANSVSKTSNSKPLRDDAAAISPSKSKTH